MNNEKPNIIIKADTTCEECLERAGIWGGVSVDCTCCDKQGTGSIPYQEAVDIIKKTIREYFRKQGVDAYPSSLMCCCILDALLLGDK